MDLKNQESRGVKNLSLLIKAEGNVTDNSYITAACKQDRHIWNFCTNLQTRSAPLCFKAALIYAGFERDPKALHSKKSDVVSAPVTAIFQKLFGGLLFEGALQSKAPLL